jgi:hypothetical protein
MPSKTRKSGRRARTTQQVVIYNRKPQRHNTLRGTLGLSINALFEDRTFLYMLRKLEFSRTPPEANDVLLMLGWREDIPLKKPFVLPRLTPCGQRTFPAQSQYCPPPPVHVVASELDKALAIILRLDFPRDPVCSLIQFLPHLQPFRRAEESNET